MGVCMDIPSPGWSRCSAAELDTAKQEQEAERVAKNVCSVSGMRPRKSGYGWADGQDYRAESRGPGV